MYVIRQLADCQLADWTTRGRELAYPRVVQLPSGLHAAASRTLHYFRVAHGKIFVRRARGVAVIFARRPNGTRICIAPPHKTENAAPRLCTLDGRRTTMNLSGRRAEPCHTLPGTPPLRCFTTRLDLQSRSHAVTAVGGPMHVKRVPHLRLLKANFHYAILVADRS